MRRRVPCLGLHRDAAGDAGRAEGGAGDGRLAVRRRSRGASARRGASRRLARRIEAALQFHGPPAVARGRACADPAAQACRAHIGQLFEHRSRPRLPLSVLVLHHHQRSGAQEPLPHRPTTSSRSFAPTRRRASTGSSSPTTISPATATGRSCSTASSRSSRRASTSASPSRSTRSATRSRTSSRRRPQAGVRRVFIGLENINPENLIAAKKRQNKITEYRVMLQKWRAHGALDLRRLHPRLSRRHEGIDPARHRDHQARTAARHSGVLLPHAAAGLGGSQEVCSTKGVWMDPDINKYDLNHRVSHHAKMTDAEWEEAYRAAWQSFYTFDHIRTILRRAAAIPNGRPKPDSEHDRLVQADDRLRGRSSARRRRLPAQVPARPPLRPASSNRRSSFIRATAMRS